MQGLVFPGGSTLFRLEKFTACGFKLGPLLFLSFLGGSGNLGGYEVILKVARMRAEPTSQP